jgi:hypothetical protein
VVRDADVAQQSVHGVVAAEERVQARLEDVAVAVAPRRQLAAEDRPLLEDERGPPGIRQIFGRGKARRAAADDDRVEGCSCDQG